MTIENELSEPAKRIFAGLTDAEKFIFSAGSVADEVEPDLLIKEPTKRMFMKVGGKILGDLAAGEGDVDFSKIDFKIFISEYKRLKLLLR